MTKEEFEAFKQAWLDYPTQDNEGYQPDRAGFKCGWVAAIEYNKERVKEYQKIALDFQNRYNELLNLYKP